MTEVRNHSSEDYQSLSVVYTRADEPHSNLYGKSGGHILALEVLPDLVAKSREHFVRVDVSRHDQRGPIAWLMTRLYQESQQTDEASALVIENLALEIIGESSRRVTLNTVKSTLWLERAREILHGQFFENLTLAEIASAVGVHPVHLARAFRRAYRCSVGEYVRQLRLDFASRELSNTDTSLAAIASDAGFSDQSHFTRTFRQRTGFTPAAFRATFRLR